MYKEVTATRYARPLVDNVVRLYGMPKVIIAYRNPRFTRKFCTELFFILGTGLQLSTAFHPQTDGQSEVTFES